MREKLSVFPYAEYIVIVLTACANLYLQIVTDVGASFELLGCSRPRFICWLWCYISHLLDYL